MPRLKTSYKRYFAVESPSSMRSTRSRIASGWGNEKSAGVRMSSLWTLANGPIGGHDVPCDRPSCELSGDMASALRNLSMVRHSPSKNHCAFGGAENLQSQCRGLPRIACFRQPGRILGYKGSHHGGGIRRSARPHAQLLDLAGGR